MSDKPTILIADDERMLRRALARILLRAGFSSLVAEDGQQAIDIFKQKSAEIDLVVLDMNMPIKNGVQAFYGIRELDPNMKIVIASGESRNEVLQHTAGRDMVLDRFIPVIPATAIFLDMPRR